MKRFQIDTNFNWFCATRPSIYRSIVEELGFEPGERVLVYQDDDEWYGTVCFDSSAPEQYQWYVILDLD